MSPLKISPLISIAVQVPFVARVPELQNTNVPSFHRRARSHGQHRECMFSAADWRTLCSVHVELLLFHPTCYPSNLVAEAALTGVDPYIHMLVLHPHVGFESTAFLHGCC